VEKIMERAIKEENKKSKINRIISYVVIVISVIVLAFCIKEIVNYVILVNENAALTKDLETLKQDSNYLRESFPVLSNDEYYSVYIDNDYQYVDSYNDTVSMIR
jgi:hypothetical protein